MGYKPKVRFNGFTNDWEQRKCKDIFDKVGNPVETKEDETYREIGIRSHGKGIFYKDEVTSKDLGNKRVFWIEPDCFILNIVFAWERAVARTTEKELGMIASHRFPMYKPKAGVVDLDYITKFFTTDKGKDILEMASPGGAGRNKTLGQKEFADSKLWLSSYDEQKKIGKLIDELDKAIDLQQRKCDETKELKKYMLQKLFPKNGAKKPEIRFNEFTDDWEQRKVSDVAEVVGGGTPSTTNPEYWDGDINWYAPAEIGEQIYVDSSERKITKLGLEKSSAKILPAHKTVLFTSRAGIGNTAILSTPAATNQGFQSMVLHDDINPYFVFSMTDMIKGKAEKVASGSTFAEISGKMLGNLEFMFPSKDEQDKIGCYFESLDNLITLHQRKYEEHITLKQFFLQNMF